MGLANPWLLLALAALAVPVLVHLVQREEHGGLKFPSLMFVRKIPFEIKRRRRLRDRALLGLRCLGVIALALAFASPYLHAGLTPASGPGSGRDLVILLDNSYSMSLPLRWRQAQDAAAARIEGLAPGDRAALVAFGNGATVVADLSEDKATLREALARLNPSGGRTGFGAAFGAANRLLGESGAHRRELVLITDLQRSALEQAGSLPLHEDVALEIVPVTGEAGANVTVVDAFLAQRGRSDVDDKLLVRLRNTGDAALEAGRLDVFIDERLAETRNLALAPGETRTEGIRLVLAADRPNRLTLWAGPDALPADDRYHVVLAPRRPVDVALLVDPGHRHSHQGVYLEQAWRLSRAPSVTTKRVSADDVDAGLLERFDVVVIDDVPIPSASTVADLESFVRGGGGVLAVLGPATDRIGPQGDVAFLPSMVETPSPASGTPHRVALEHGDHPLWAALGQELGALFSGAEVTTVRRVAPNGGDRVLARTGNGDPLLVARDFGAGRSLILATTADPRWGSLALEPGFVPLAQAMVAYLAGRTGWKDAFVAGEVVDLARVAGNLPDGADWTAYLGRGGAVVVETPSGAALRLDRAAGALFTPREAGIYEAHRTDGAGGSIPFAVNAARAESALAAATMAEFERRIVRRTPPAVTGRQAIRDRESDPFGLARWLLILAALALMAESALGNRISRRRLDSAVIAR